MKDENISSVLAGMPARLMQRPGEAGGHLGRGIARYGVQRLRRCDGRAALPDARVRASTWAWWPARDCECSPEGL
jgi:hypothetical protein